MTEKGGENSEQKSYRNNCRSFTDNGGDNLGII